MADCRGGARTLSGERPGPARPRSASSSSSRAPGVASPASTSPSPRPPRSWPPSPPPTAGPWTDSRRPALHPRGDARGPAAEHALPPRRGRAQRDHRARPGAGRARPSPSASSSTRSPRCASSPQNSLRYRRQILALKQFFAGRDCTVVFLDDRNRPRPKTCSSRASPTASSSSSAPLPATAPRAGASRCSSSAGVDFRRRLPRLHHRPRRARRLPPPRRRLSTGSRTAGRRSPAGFPDSTRCSAAASSAARAR